MKAVLNGKEMKEFDARSIKGYGIPSLVLMERAAMAVAEKAEEILEKEEAGTVWSVCGFGNNGADGVAAARMLFLKGYDVKIVFPQRDGKGSEELEAQLNVVKRAGNPGDDGGRSAGPGGKADPGRSRLERPGREKEAAGA